MQQSETRTQQARRLRASMTRSEAYLWSMLRNRQINGLKFRRQAPVANAIADFACHTIRLVIELDGGIHDLRAERDAARDARIRAAGYTVLRFRNGDFSRNPAIVLNAIKHHHDALLPSREKVAPQETDEGKHHTPSERL